VFNIRLVHKLGEPADVRDKKQAFVLHFFISKLGRKVIHRDPEKPSSRKASICCLK
jgi:hypothetical protein